MHHAPDLDAARSFLMDLLAATSPSTREREAAAVLSGQLTALGFDVEHDRLGNVIGSRDWGPGPTVLFDSHLDTVDVTDPDRWTVRPSGQVVGSRVHGRGAVDMKGPLAALVFGVAALGRGRRAGRVVISGTVSEELVEGPAVTAVARRAAPDRVVICEPSGGVLAVAQRGRAEVEVDIIGRTCHSAYPAHGRNAAEAAAAAVMGLRDLVPPNDPTLGPGVLVLVELVSRPAASTSMVPEGCLIRFDRRTLPGESADDVLEPIAAALEVIARQWEVTATVRLARRRFTTYTGVGVEALCFAPAWRVAPQDSIVRAALAGFAAAGLDVPLGHYAFCTNGSATAGTLGIPTIGYGPGDPRRAHTVDEYIDSDEFDRGCVGYAALAHGLTTRP